MTASNHNQPAAPWCNCGFRFRAYKRGRLNTAWKERCFCVETPKRGERRPSIRCVAGSVKPVLATISYGKEGGESIQGTIEVVGMKAFGTQFEIYSASGRTYFLCLESEGVVRTGVAAWMRVVPSRKISMHLQMVLSSMTFTTSLQDRSHGRAPS